MKTTKNMKHAANLENFHDKFTKTIKLLPQKAVFALLSTTH